MDANKKLRFDRIEDWFYRWQCWRNIESMKELGSEEHIAVCKEFAAVEREGKRLGVVCIDGQSFLENYV